MNQSLLWGVFAVGLVCCWLCSPGHPCVCSFVWGCPWRGGWAGGTGEQLRVCWECTEQGLCSHAALQSMNSHPGQHPGHCCHSLKGKIQPRIPSPKQKGLEACDKCTAVCSDRDCRELLREGQSELSAGWAQAALPGCPWENGAARAALALLGCCWGCPWHQELLDCALNLQKSTLWGYSTDPEQISVLFSLHTIRKVKFIQSWFCFNLMHPW